jgi:hypothetical protein
LRTGVETLIETWNGSTWTDMVPMTMGTSTNLDAVSCSSPTFCVAAGSYVSGGDQLNGAERWDGSAWSALSVPSAATNDNYLSGVTCVSPNSCAAVGDVYSISSSGAYSVTDAVTEFWDGSSWSMVPNPDPAPSVAPTALLAASCVSASTCVAVGDQAFAGEGPKALIESGSGSSWSITPSMVVSGGLAGVSCVTAQQTIGPDEFCAAVGDNSAGRALVETYG